MGPAPSSGVRVGLAVALALTVSLSGVAAGFLTETFPTLSARATSATPGPVGQASETSPPSGAWTELPGSAGIGPSGTVLVAGVPPTRDLAFTIELAIPDTPGWTAYQEELNTPGSYAVLHPISIWEFFQRFGPSSATVGELVAYLQGQGLVVEPTDGPLLYSVSGPAFAVDRALRISLGIYEANGSRGMLPNVSPSLPATFAGAVQSFQGLDTLNGPHPESIFSHPLSAPTCNSPTCITPTVMRTFYNETGLLAEDSGDSEIGLAEMCDPLENSSYYSSDVATFDGYYGLPAPTITLIGDGAYNCTDTGYPGWGEETDLDIQWAHAIAPGAALVVCLDRTDPGDCDQTFVTMGIPFGSNSWGGPWNTTSIWQAAAAAGVDLLSASGDKDKYASSTQTSFPASLPDGLGIGGTCIDPGAGGVYGSEAGWGESPCSHTSGEGSGGGCDSLNAPPSYQLGTPGYPGVCTTSERGIPDLAMDADPSSGVVIVSEGIESEEGGTSLATPMWAGVLDVTFQASGFTGFVDPYLYAFAKGPDASKILHNVTTGGNGYSCTAGWNPVTGVGTPNIGGLAYFLGLVPQNLSVSVAATPTNVTLGGMVDAIASPHHGTSPFSYRWLLNGTTASGAPNSPYWNWTPAHGGTYLLAVQVTDGAPATATSTNLTIVVQSPAATLYPIAFSISPTACTLAFNGTTFSNSGGGSYAAGRYALVASPCLGYLFKQWNTSGGVTVASAIAASTTAIVAGSGSVTAWFQANSSSSGDATVHFVVLPSACAPISFDGVDEYNGSSGLVPTGSYSANAFACAGYQMTPGWSVSGALSLPKLVANLTTVTVKGNGTLTMTYTPNIPPPSGPYWVNFTVAPALCGPIAFNGTNEANGSSVLFPGGDYSASANACPGHSFAGWFTITNSIRGVLSGNPVTVDIDANTTLIAEYQQDFSVGLSANATSLMVGESVSLSPDPAGGEGPYDCMWVLNATNTTSGACTPYNVTLDHGGDYVYRVWATDATPATLESAPVTVDVTSPKPKEGSPVTVFLTASSGTINVGQSVTLTLTWTPGGCGCDVSSWVLNGTNDSSLGPASPYEVALHHGGNYTFRGWVADNSTELAESPAVTVDVLSSPGGSGGPGTPSSQGLGTTDLLLVATLVVTLIIGAVWFSRRTRPPPPASPPSYG